MSAARVDVVRATELLGRHVERRAEHARRRSSRSASRRSVVTLEMPKSSTLTTGGPSRSCARNRFAGLRSRWTMPARAPRRGPRTPGGRSSTACATAAGRAPRRAAREIAALEVLHHHVRRAVVELADVEDARDVLALELGRRPAPRARSARRRPGARRRSGRRNLMATRSSSSRCVAATTTPMPPAPSAARPGTCQPRGSPGEQEHRLRTLVHSVGQRESAYTESGAAAAHPMARR